MTSLGVLKNVLAASYNPNEMIRFCGTVSAVSANAIQVEGLSNHVLLGQVVRIGNDDGNGKLGEVVRIENGCAHVCPFDDSEPCMIGDRVVAENQLDAKPTTDWLGRIVNSLGKAMDGGSEPPMMIADPEAQIAATKVGAMQRARLDKPLKTGVKTIDIFTPLCRGQRLGIFAGSGVGKSTLLSMLAMSTAFDVVVLALVGERGREVREFMEDTLGEEGMKKSVVVVATSDESPMLRRRAPELALDVCESFQKDGKDVLLLVDSITRYAHSLREISVSNGEPPIARGYPSSVFTQLPKLLERAGGGAEGEGSITAVITVLVEGDDQNDPIADAVRGIIDGHLVLDRSIAEEGRYPPINPLNSVSRLADKAWSKDERNLVLQLKRMISKFEETKDLRMLGGWKPGSDIELDKAVETVPVIYEALCQLPDAPLSKNAFDDLVQYLKGQPPESENHASTPQ